MASAGGGDGDEYLVECILEEKRSCSEAMAAAAARSVDRAAADHPLGFAMMAAAVAAPRQQHQTQRQRPAERELPAATPAGSSSARKTLPSPGMVPGDF